MNTLILLACLLVGGAIAWLQFKIYQVLVEIRELQHATEVRRIYSYSILGPARPFVPGPENVLHPEK